MNSYCIFEAIHPRSREVVVGISEEPTLAAIRARHYVEPPDWLKRWGNPRDADFRLIESCLTLHEALAIVAQYPQATVNREFQVRLRAR